MDILMDFKGCVKTAGFAKRQLDTKALLMLKN